MEAITYSNARKHFAEVMDRVCLDHEPLIITRQASSSVVLMSLEDFNAIEETAYLLRSPANAANLRASLHQLEQGKTTARDLLKP